MGDPVQGLSLLKLRIERDQPPAAKAVVESREGDDRQNRNTQALCGFFVLALLGFAGALGGGGNPSAPLNWAFYLFGDAWSTVWVTTFWAYLTELTRTEQSKRLYGLIGAGGVIGGLMANFAVWQYIEKSGIGVLLTAAAGGDDRRRPDHAAPRGARGPSGHCDRPAARRRAG